MESLADGSLAATTLTPAHPLPATVEGRLLDLARAHDRPAVTDKLPVLFGTATCPRCHASIDTAQALN